MLTRYEGTQATVWLMPGRESGRQVERPGFPSVICTRISPAERAESPEVVASAVVVTSFTGFAQQSHRSGGEIPHGPPLNGKLTNRFGGNAFFFCPPARYPTHWPDTAPFTTCTKS
jgi:hypothetical protein